jgi:hypothetical protein
LEAVEQAYVDAVMAFRPMQEWIAGAEAEPDRIPEYEIYAR